MTAGDIVRATFGTLVLMVAFIVRPQHASCPLGSFAEGVRPRGSTDCVAVPTTKCDDTRSPENGQPRCPEKDFNQWRGSLQIYCTNGSVPILIDSRTIGCQARH